MKKLLIIFICLLSNQFSIAQLNGYGLKGGVTLGNQYWNYQTLDEANFQNFKLGYNGLIFLSFLNHNSISIETELQFNQKGASGTDLVFNQDFESRINLVSLNAFLKIRKESFSNSFYLLMGPKVEYLIGNSYPGINQNFNIEPVVAAGPGFEYFLNLEWAVSLEMLFNYAPLNFYKSDIYNISNRSIEFRVGIKKLLDPLKNFDRCPPVHL